LEKASAARRTSGENALKQKPKSEKRLDRLPYLPTSGKRESNGMTMLAAVLPDRGVIKLTGEATRALLDRLVTADVDTLQPGDARFAALLTPQGKILFDFIVVEAPPKDGGGFFLDCPRALAADLAKRLVFYRLRAKVEIEDMSDRLAVMAAWDKARNGASDEAQHREASGGGRQTGEALCYPDPRLPALGMRMILPPAAAAAAAADLGAALSDADAYEQHRIALGIPRGGEDFIYGGAYPHETDMDQLGGVDFTKGCFVGQEVVARMQHRSTARSRIVPVTYSDAAPMSGLPVTAGEKTVGTIGSTAGGRGLALLRLDRVSDAMEKNLPLIAGGVELKLRRPDWARFRFPGEPEPTA
jgi:folate-binding protein YgfZ